MHSAKIAAKIREQILRFSGEVSVGLPKTAARLVREVIYGVQTRGSVRLSEIARALEETIRLKKVMARLSRQLNRQGLREQVRKNLLRLAAPRVGTETLLVVDLTDVYQTVCAQDGVSGPGPRRFGQETGKRILVLPSGRLGARERGGDTAGSGTVFARSAGIRE